MQLVVNQERNVFVLTNRGLAQAFTDAYFGQGSSSQVIWLRQVACDGSEPSISNCPRSGWNDTARCTHAEDAGVSCTSSLTTVTSRPTTTTTAPPRICLFFM